MIQAYQGYFRDGRFISSETAVIPNNVKAYVMIVDDESPITQTKAQRQGQAIKKFLTAIDKTDEKFTAEDFAELEENRANFSREVNL